MTLSQFVIKIDIFDIIFDLVIFLPDIPYFIRNPIIEFHPFIHAQGPMGENLFAYLYIIKEN